MQSVEWTEDTGTFDLSCSAELTEELVFCSTKVKLIALLLRFFFLGGFPLFQPLPFGISTFESLRFGFDFDLSYHSTKFSRQCANLAATIQCAQILDDCHIGHEESQENCPDLLLC